MGGSSASKKDVRGLPISAPRSASPQKPDGHLGSGSGPHTPRVQSGIPSPMGPRPLGPRGAGARGSFTPPPPPPPPPPGEFGYRSISNVCAGAGAGVLVLEEFKRVNG